MFVYPEELGHTIMEADKPHDVLSASWMPRKPSGVRPSVRSEDSTAGSKKKGLTPPSSLYCVPFRLSVD